MINGNSSFSDDHLVFLNAFLYPGKKWRISVLGRGYLKDQGGDVASFRAKEWKIYVIERWVRMLDMEVTLHDKRIVIYESDVSVPTSLVYDRYKSGEGYHVVPPPYTGTFMPYKPDLVFHDAPTISETVPDVLNVEPKDEFKGKPMPTQKASSFVQTFAHVKTPRISVKPVEHPTQAENLRKDISKSRVHRPSWSRKACFVCKSVNHFIKDCDYYEKKMVQKPVWNYAMRVNH
nr:hypothetical protein [Tanacetum cinerariifolium]